MGQITVEPKWVLKLLNNLKINKASVSDGLSARVLKECSSEIAPILALIYNESLAQGTVPDDWRQSNVAPVFSSPEPKAHGELIVYQSSRRPSVRACVRAFTLLNINISETSGPIATKFYLKHHWGGGKLL